MTEGEVIIYTSDDGSAVLQLRAVGGTVWLTQALIAELYGTSLQNVSAIIGRILADGEATEATINSQLIVRTEGTRRVEREVKVYNLNMILAIGYRVTTPRAVQFRRWATTVLKEYLVKGFALQDERLKDPAGADYFDELLRRIRDIRASERRFYQKVRDIFSASSADYDGRSDTARAFFATIQNKLIFAVTGCTAGELIVKRCDPSSPTIGLTTWRGARIRKADVNVSKNYLAEAELIELNRLTTMFLDFAEDRAARRQQTLMADWMAQTDRFLVFNERGLLTGSGSVSAAEAEQTAAEAYATFDGHRRAEEAQESEVQEVEDLNELLALEAQKRPPTSRNA